MLENTYEDIGFLENSGLDVQNYDLLIAQFVALNLNDKELGADGLKYCDITSRNHLINTLNWAIEGDALAEDCDLNLNNSELGNIINFYPNPVNDLLYIQTKNGVEVQELSVYNIQGKQILFRKENVKVLHLEELSSGMYLLNIQTNQGTLNQQIIKK